MSKNRPNISMGCSVLCKSVPLVGPPLRNSSYGVCHWKFFVEVGVELCVSPYLCCGWAREAFSAFPACSGFFLLPRCSHVVSLPGRLAPLPCWNLSGAVERLAGCDHQRVVSLQNWTKNRKGCWLPWQIFKFWTVFYFYLNLSSPRRKGWCAHMGLCVSMYLFIHPHSFLHAAFWAPNFGKNPTFW